MVVALWIFCKLHWGKEQPEWLIVKAPFKESDPSFSCGERFFKTMAVAILFLFLFKRGMMIVLLLTPLVCSA